MAGLSDLANKYGKILAAWPQERQRFALIMAHDAHALTASRIQNTGKGSEGQAFKKYSTNEFNVGLLNPSLFNAPSKIVRFKKKVAKKEIKGTYENLRREYGLTTSIRNLTFDGDMWQSIEQKVTEHDEVKTVVTIRANSRKEQDKVNHNCKQLRTNILRFGKEESILIREGNTKRIEKMLNQTK